MKFHRVRGLAEITGRYDAFLIDQFGVLHDGGRLYSDAADAMAKLAAAEKSVIVMTNSGKRSDANWRRLRAMGLDLKPRQVVSSGEVAYQAIAAGTFGPAFSSGRRAHVIGKRGDDYGFDGLDLEFVATADDADFLLILGTNVPKTSIADYREALSIPARKAIPALCCNPDLEMLTQWGIAPAPGAIARAYEELGGQVTYVGKPHRAIYDHAIAVAGQPLPSRTLAVGDSVEHDVAGARAAGIAVALVLTGLSEHLAEEEIARRARDSRSTPDWVLPALKW